MSSLKVIKNRIRSVSNTKKISQTMKLVSVAKYTREEKELNAIRAIGHSPQHFFDSIEIKTSATKPKLDLVVGMSGDRGLCGAIHSGIARAVSGALNKNTVVDEDGIKLICIGEKNRVILSQIYPERILWVATEIGKKPLTFFDAGLIASKIIHTVNEHAFMRTRFCFNEFIHPGVYKVTSVDVYSRPAVYATPKYVLYDMVDDEIMDCWLEFTMAAVIFWMLKEGAVSELSARMTAMEGATKNASEMIKNLTLEFNRTRQAVITKELIEIISGASAT